MIKKTSPAKRILLDAILLLSVFFLPWWLVMLIGVIGVFAYGAYYEFIVAGVFLDVIYMPIISGHVKIFASGIFLAAFLFVYWIRTRIRS